MDDYEGMLDSFSKATVPCSRDKEQPLNNFSPHYTDERYKHPQTIFLAQGYTLKRGKEWLDGGVTYNFSDRIWQWDWNKARASSEAAKADGHALNSAAWAEVFLRHYFDAPALELAHIMAGYNLATGYAYQVYGYIEHKASSS